MAIELDTIDRITYSPEFSPIKNCHPLIYLPEGIHQLALIVRAEEIKKNNEELCPGFEALTFEPRENLISCQFHWFANSIVNYARLVAFLEITSKNGWMIEHFSDKTIKKAVASHCTKYVERIAPDIYKWRNKVSAHFASSDPFITDNMGTLQDSMFYPISYSRPYYFTHAHNFSKGGEESVIPEWSLTKTFEELSIRFFPNRKLPDIAYVPE